MQEDIAKLHEALPSGCSGASGSGGLQALTGLSGDFFEHKRLTQQVQSKLLNQAGTFQKTGPSSRFSKFSFLPFFCFRLLLWKMGDNALRLCCHRTLSPLSCSPTDAVGV